MGAAIVTEQGLTEKEEAFCQEYVFNGGNGTQAVLSAKYDCTYLSARAIAWQNLTKLHITTRIEQIRAEIRQHDIPREYVIGMLKNNAERAAQEEPVYDKEGNKTGEYKYEGGTVNRAAELLAKIGGHITEKRESKVDVNLTDGLTDEELIAKAAAVVAAVVAAREGNTAAGDRNGGMDTFNETTASD